MSALPKTKLVRSPSILKTQEPLEDYVDVKSSSGKDKKCAPPVESEETPQSLSQPQKLMIGRAPMGKMKTLRTKIAYLFNNTGSTNTAFSTVIPVQPSATTSWSQFAAVYEEVKVLGGKVKFNVSVTGSGTDPLGSNQLFAVAYNPLVSTAATSIASLCEFSQSKLFGCDNITTNTPSNGVFGCVPSTPSGLYDFDFRVPKGGSARSSSASSTFSGEWSNTNDGSDVYGWVSPYASAPGANNTWTMYGVIIMDVLFRSRF